MRECETARPMPQSPRLRLAFAGHRANIVGAMDRASEEALVDFAVEQELLFDAEAWCARPHPSGASDAERATVALLLATTGQTRSESQRSALLAVGSRLAGGRDLPTLLREVGLLPHRFVGMLDAARLHATLRS